MAGSSTTGQPATLPASLEPDRLLELLTQPPPVSARMRLLALKAHPVDLSPAAARADRPALTNRHPAMHRVRADLARGLRPAVVLGYVARDLLAPGRRELARHRCVPLEVSLGQAHPLEHELVPAIAVAVLRLR